MVCSLCWVLAVRPRVPDMLPAPIEHVVRSRRIAVPRSSRPTTRLDGPVTMKRDVNGPSTQQHLKSQSHPAQSTNDSFVNGEMRNAQPTEPIQRQEIAP